MVKMKRCPHCGKETPVQMNHCVHCMAQLDEAQKGTVSIATGWLLFLLCVLLSIVLIAVSVCILALRNRKGNPSKDGDPSDVSTTTESVAIEETTTAKETAVGKTTTGKETTTEKEITTGQETTTGRESTTGKEPTTGKKATTGKEPATGKKTTTGKESTTGKKTTTTTTTTTTKPNVSSGITTIAPEIESVNEIFMFENATDVDDIEIIDGIKKELPNLDFRLYVYWPTESKVAFFEDQVFGVYWRDDEGDFNRCRGNRMILEGEEGNELRFFVCDVSDAEDECLYVVQLVDR